LKNLAYYFLDFGPLEAIQTASYAGHGQLGDLVGDLGIFYFKQNFIKGNRSTYHMLAHGIQGAMKEFICGLSPGMSSSPPSSSSL